MPPQQNQVPPAAPQQAPSQALAIVALVLGIIGLVPYFGVLFAIAAVIVGFVGLSHIKKGIASGHGLALAGVIMGFAGLVISICAAILFSIAAIGFLGAASSAARDARQHQGDSFPTQYQSDMPASDQTNP